MIQSSVSAINRLNRTIGQWVSWLTLGMVLITFVVVILRYLFNVGWVWLQEIVIYLHAITFLSACASTLLENGHVRVDVLYGSASKEFQAWADLIGSVLFLAPTCILLFMESFPYVKASWQVWEGSKDSGGLDGVYLLKSFILVFCVLTFLQGLSLALSSFLELRGGGDHE